MSQNIRATGGFVVAATAAARTCSGRAWRACRIPGSGCSPRWSSRRRSCPPRGRLRARPGVISTRLQEAEHVGEPEPDEAHTPLLDRAQDVLELALHAQQCTDVRVASPQAGDGPVTERSYTGNGREIARRKAVDRLEQSGSGATAPGAERQERAVAIKAEYIWIDGTEPTARLRSKTKILDGRRADLPIWGFDGSSTNQAPGKQLRLRAAARSLVSPTRSAAATTCS